MSKVKRTTVSQRKKVPKKLQGILWSVNVDQLDLEQDKIYIINQVLMYGGFKELRWLFKRILPICYYFERRKMFR